MYPKRKNMKLDFKNINKFIYLTLLLQSYLSNTYASLTKCDQSCGATSHLPFPFGFSAGCPIQLNCTTDGTISIAGFSVHKITGDSISVNLPPECDRPLESIRHLYSHNFAPTSRNGLLLQNCTTQVTGCVIPTTMVQTRLEMLDCGNLTNTKNNISSTNNNTISCYSEQKSNSTSLFIEFENIMKTTCRSLITAISTSTETFTNSSALSLDVQLIRLGWWLEGSCRCSDDATCTTVISPINGKASYRCNCNDGLVGDGFRAGFGCRKDTGCNASRYLSGHCGGTARVVLIGGIAAGAIFMVGFGILCCFLRRRANCMNRKTRNQKPFETKGISIPVYPYKEIEKATQSFSDKRRLGTGAYGTVYCGKLSNADQLVAIKRIKHRADTDSIDQVMNEIKLLSSVSHPNLVRLLGCSIEKGEQILVYEYMPNGTLCQHLHRDRGNGLTWPVRLTIASETAQAIAYLHSAMNPPIYHRDIKSSNILLDHEYNTKVADFGLSRLGMVESSHISTAPQGTPGYLDPQYHQNFHLSDKSDVYSFGVVLVEIITAMKVIDFTREQNEVNLVSFAIDRIAKERLVEIIDPFIAQHMDDYTSMSVHKVAELAFSCLAFQSDMRPSMAEVAAELEQIRKLSKCGSLEENNTKSLGESSSNSSIIAKKLEVEREELFSNLNTNYSPISVRHSWLNDRSSPSSNSLLSHPVQ